MFRRLTPHLRSCLVALLSLSLTVPFGAVAQVQPSFDTDAFTRAVADQRRVIEELRRGLDPTEFDVGALGLEMAFDDAEEIIEVLLDRLSYEVYPGVLRGAQGTLVAGAGNALDQALLLGPLLADAGYQTRLAFGELDEADARRLVERMFEPTVENAPQLSDDAIIERLAQASGATAEEMATAVAGLQDLDIESTEAYLLVDGTRDRIVEALRSAGLELGGDMGATLLAEARDYAWVEYRFSSAEDWQAAHLAFGRQPAPTVEADDHLDGDLPTELLHRLRVEVAIERKVGDDFIVESLMTPWERPVANMFGLTLSVGNLPWGAGADASLLELGTDLAEVSFFVPTLNGSLAPGAQAFDTLGHVLPPDVAADPAAAVFQTVAGRMAGATSLLGNLGAAEGEEPSEVLALTAQWVDFVLIAPGGEETRHRRFIFDRRSPEARASGGEALLDQSVLLEGILSEQSFMVFPGALSPAYLAQETSLHALAALHGLEALADGLVADPEGPVDLLLADAFGDLEPRDHLKLLGAFDALGPGDGGVAYRAEPTVLILHQAITPGPVPVVRAGVDIVHNARRFLARQGGTVVADAERAILAGAWETQVERAYVQRSGDAVHGTYAAFAAASGQRVVAPGDVASLEGIPVPSEALTALTRDLEAGYAVVLPTGEGVEAAGFAWWRVDPFSGETLGVGSDGRGAALTEYITKEGLIAAAVITAVMAVPGIGGCLATATGAALAVCICDSITNSLLLGGLGLLLGGLLLGAGLYLALAAWTITELAVLSPLYAIPGLMPGWCSTIWGSLGPDQLVCLVA